MNGLIEELRSLVGNENGFVHKKLLGGISAITSKLGFIPGASAVSAITGSLAGRTLPRTQVARVTRFSEAEKQFGRAVKFESEGPSLGERFLQAGQEFVSSRLRPSSRPLTLPGQRNIVVPSRVHPQAEGPCLPPLIRGPQGLCIAPTSPLGASRLVGEATMGQYGAALIPGSQIVDRATCLRGMQLGNDGLCYNKGNITNKQRMWPAGRKPLLTGGDMRAISTAARAGRRMELATKRLQRMGMMKKPAARRALPRGHVARLEHASEH